MKIIKTISNVYSGFTAMIIGISLVIFFVMNFKNLFLVTGIIFFLSFAFSLGNKTFSYFQWLFISGPLAVFFIGCSLENAVTDTENLIGNLTVAIAVLTLCYWGQRCQFKISRNLFWNTLNIKEESIKPIILLQAIIIIISYFTMAALAVIAGSIIFFTGSLVGIFELEWIPEYVIVFFMSLALIIIVISFFYKKNWELLKISFLILFRSVIQFRIRYREDRIGVALLTIFFFLFFSRCLYSFIKEQKELVVVNPEKSLWLQDSITTIVSEKSGIEKSLIKPNTPCECLGLDWLDEVELVVEFETSFGVDIPESKERFTTVNDAVITIFPLLKDSVINANYLQHKKNKKKPNTIAEDLKNNPKLRDEEDSAGGNNKEIEQSSLVVFNSGNFGEKVLKYNKPVMVFFRGDWCGPCRMVGPILEDIAKEYEGKVVVGKLDVYENKDIAQKYNIQDLPTVLIFKNGRVADKLTGAMPKLAYSKKLDAQLIKHYQ